MFAGGYARTLGVIVGNLYIPKYHFVYSDLSRGTMVEPLRTLEHDKATSCSVTPINGGSSRATTGFGELLEDGAGTMVYANTSGIFNRELPATGLTELTRRGKTLFVLSTTRATNVIGVSVEHSRVSFLYATKRGNLCNPVNAKLLIVGSSRRLGSLVRNNANDFSTILSRPRVCPSQFRDKALGMPKVLSLNRKVHFISGHNISQVCGDRRNRVTSVCGTLGGVPGIHLCASPFSSRGDCIPLLSFGISNLRDRRATTLLTGSGVTIETNLRYTPSTRGACKALHRNAIEVTPSVFAGGRSIGLLLASMMGVTGGD